MLVALVVAAILLVVALAAGGAIVTRQLLAAKDAFIADLHAALSIARTRVAHLELTIDEIRARELSTTPPEPVVVKPERLPLPPEIQARLDEIDDPSGELEELARSRIEANPDADMQAIADELFV